MKKRTIFLLLLLAALSQSMAQAPPAPQRGEFKKPPFGGLGGPGGGGLRAVVVGISDYEDPAIPDLQFADRDAEAFADWLRSVGAGEIRMLLNSQATIGNLYKELEWLVDQSREGDRAVIYFSGHGDIESKTRNKEGFLLCYNSPPNNYRTNAFAVYWLKDIIEQLSLDKKAQVVVVTDACRAGKLAGAEVNGAQLTTAALQEQFSNEIKILSCQPNEYSLEGTEWGGGRGVFSYHLVNALYGMADRDEDQLVKLKELSRYLEDHVPVQADPLPQNPLVLGDREATLARVDAAALAVVRASLQQPVVFSPADMKGYEENLLAGMDSSLQEIYRAFWTALERGELMEAAEGRRSADDCYRLLSAAPEMAALQGLMKRNFVAALIDEAQGVINRLLKTDPQVVSDVWSRPFLFDHIPARLARATELLGERHYLFTALMAKQCYFEAKTYRTDRYPGVPADTLLARSVIKMEEGLGYDSSAAYLYLDLGITLFWRFFKFDIAMEHAQKALALSPNWAYAHVLAGRCHAEGEMALERGAQHYRRALELDSTCLLAWQELFWMYELHASPEKKYYSDRYIREVETLMATGPENVPVYHKTWYGMALTLSGRLEEALTVLHEVEQLTHKQNFVCYQILDEVYFRMGMVNDQVKTLLKLIELNPGNNGPHYKLATIYLHLQQPEQVIELLSPVLKKETGPEKIFFPISQPMLNALLGEAYRAIGQEEKAEEQFNIAIGIHLDSIPHLQLYPIPKARAFLRLGDLKSMQKHIEDGLAMAPDNPWVYYLAANSYALANDEKQAIYYLEKAIQKGLDDEALIRHDYDLANIWHTEGFKALMEKYFPRQKKE